jgi:hypothetical protein
VSVGIEPSDLGRFEPSPYDLGITEDPDVTWATLGTAADLAGLHEGAQRLHSVMPVPEPVPELEICIELEPGQ